MGTHYSNKRRRYQSLEWGGKKGKGPEDHERKVVVLPSAVRSMKAANNYVSRDGFPSAARLFELLATALLPHMCCFASLSHSPVA